jgi:diguanylate cyclase (GGDEF)-like protein
VPDNPPQSTLKFPKVAVPVDEPAQTGVAKSRDQPPRTGTVVEQSDEPPTLRGTHVSIAPVPASHDRASITVLRGVNAGQLFRVERTVTVIGRARGADLHLEEEGISRRHARIERREGRYVLEDLGSTNGVFLNGVQIERADLSDGDRIQLGPAILVRFSLIAEDEAAIAQRLYEGSTRDGLTRVYNRKYLMERLTAEVAHAQRQRTLLSVILFDLDHFKRVNDTLGHPAGDAVLQVVAAQVQRTIRREDVLARYGGEEFAVLVRGIPWGNVAVVAERVRLGVERLAIPWEGTTVRVTVSLGVASLSDCALGATSEALLAAADARLYVAKSGGRNRVC